MKQSMGESFVEVVSAHHDFSSLQFITCFDQTCRSLFPSPLLQVDQSFIRITVTGACNRAT
jgi:hypothetical protein